MYTDIKAKPKKRATYTIYSCVSNGALPSTYEFRNNNIAIDIAIKMFFVLNLPLKSNTNPAAITKNHIVQLAPDVVIIDNVTKNNNTLPLVIEWLKQPGTASPPQILTVMYIFNVFLNIRISTLAYHLNLHACLSSHTIKSPQNRYKAHKS